MNLNFTVTGKSDEEIRTKANAVIAQFMRSGHYSYGIAINVGLLVGSPERGTALWQGRVAVTDLQDKS